ncbi:MAG: DegT/DnrJ/EryC1/StrS family aminotransferase [Endomicrobiales bacterium]|nr:DegT/DnrJ/EryC1/StrS family aminotransferase [Endomicrobiales bacterium]
MIKLTDLNEQYLSIKTEIDAAVKKVIDEANFILGPQVRELESGVAKYCECKYAVGVASGTDALLLALIASGIKPGDEVITTPVTFVATTEAIMRCGAVPVFCDIDPKTNNIDPQHIEKKITKKTKAILPVHLYGQPCDIDGIKAAAQKHGLKIIEDCAQSIGTLYKGKKAGSLGDAGCLSFFPAKTLGCYGDGGMIVTNNADIAEKAVLLRNHGSKVKNFLDTHGFNSRLDTLQAAILVVKLKHLDKWIEMRRKNAAIYDKLLSEVKGIEIIPEAPYGRHSYNYYTLKVKAGKEKRDALEKHLIEKGVACGVYYPLALHLQKIYGHLGHKKGDFPVSEKFQDETLSLPLYPELDKDKMGKVVAAISGFLAGS